MVRERSERRKRTQKICSRRDLSRAAKRARNRKGPRAVSERLSRGKGVPRGKPKTASMRNGHIRGSDMSVAIRSVVFGLPLKMRSVVLGLPLKKRSKTECRGADNFTDRVARNRAYARLNSEVPGDRVLRVAPQNAKRCFRVAMNPHKKTKTERRGTDNLTGRVARNRASRAT